MGGAAQERAGAPQRGLWGWARRHYSVINLRSVNRRAGDADGVGTPERGQKLTDPDNDKTPLCKVLGFQIPVAPVSDTAPCCSTSLLKERGFFLHPSASGKKSCLSVFTLSRLTGSLPLAKGNDAFFLALRGCCFGSQGVLFCPSRGVVGSPQGVVWVFSGH